MKITHIWSIESRVLLRWKRAGPLLCITPDPLTNCFKENGYTDVNTSCEPNEKLNIPGTINPVASISVIATKKRQTCREDLDLFRMSSNKKTTINS